MSSLFYFGVNSDSLLVAVGSRSNFAFLIIIVLLISGESLISFAWYSFVYRFIELGQCEFGFLQM